MNHHEKAAQELLEEVAGGEVGIVKIVGGPRKTGPFQGRQWRYIVIDELIPMDLPLRPSPEQRPFWKGFLLAVSFGIACWSVLVWLIVKVAESGRAVGW